MTFTRRKRDADAEAPTPVPGVVTALREHPRKKGRYSLKIGGIAAGDLSAESVGELGLRVGAMVDAALLPRVLAAARLTQCYDKALEALARRSRSAADLGRWLRARDCVADDIASTLEKLTTLGLLDDLTFARGFARSRAAGKGFGRRRIAAELARKGVARGVVDEVLAELAEDLDQSEPEAMLAAAEKRARSLASLAPEVAQRRLFGWLVRRGYDGRAASDVARRLFPRSR